MPNKVLAGQYRLALPDEETLVAELQRTQRALEFRGSPELAEPARKKKQAKASKKKTAKTGRKKATMAYWPGPFLPVGMSNRHWSELTPGAGSGDQGFPMLKVVLWK